ncbi:MAG: Ig-like domain-containing protein, partial [Desulfobacterales bacterium]|nr:Ig-like domain-containing protein [Desulfobacterales bacterium]
MFAFESNSPDIALSNIAISSQESDRQHLVISLNASDDVDIAEIGVSVSGVYGHVLKAAGGVVDNATADAFAKTDGYLKVYPIQDGQGEFQAVIPVHKNLSADEIAHDGIVFIDAYCQDSSGHRKKISEIGYTGNDVSESASNLQILFPSTGKLHFTSPLETSAVVPAVEFEFRGLTPLPGAGTGVEYSSNRPDFVGVTSSGVVYPLKETGSESVVITVSYPGLDPVTISAVVDFSVEIASLQQEEIRLESLNRYYDMVKPKIVLSNGIITGLSDHHQIRFELPESTDDFLAISDMKVRSSQAIPAESSVPVKVWVEGYPQTETTWNFSAQDALPSISISSSPVASPGERIEFSLMPADDVGVTEVKLYQGETLVASFVKPPWTFFTQALPQDVGKSLTFFAEVVDTAGQLKRSAPATVMVKFESEDDVPELDFEKPVEMQRCVEGSPVRFQLSRQTGESPDPSGIHYVEFFLDGAKVGESYFPFFESRPIQTMHGQKEVWFEVWRLNRDLPQISTHETSMGYHALIHGSGGATRKTESGLVRVVENQAPSVDMRAPHSNAPVVSGQMLSVKAVMSDDTLGGGTRLELLVDGAVEGDYFYSNLEELFKGDYLNKVKEHTFQYKVPDLPSGTKMGIALKATDYHGVSFQTEPVFVRMKHDESPMVTLSSPQEGAQLVAGLPFEMRAEAKDDVGVARVDFYVDGQLVGSDDAAPYQFIFQKMVDLKTSQTLRLKAVALDTLGQKGESGAVTVTLGRDEVPPVVYIVSPEVNETVAGVDTATLVEGDIVVIKLTGYDNVGASKLKLTGIKAEGSGYTLSGDPGSVLEGDRLPLQAVPGTLQAFSSLIKVKIPSYKGGSGGLDLYEITATVWDKAGNESEKSLQLGVSNDAPPTVVRILSNKETVFYNDKLHVDIHGADDLGVEAFELTWSVEGSGFSPVVETYHKYTEGAAQGEQTFNPGKVVQLSLSKSLDALGFAFDSGNYNLLLTVKAMDETGQASEPETLSITVAKDTQAPELSILSPVSGSTLYAGQPVTLRFKAVDDCQISSVGLKYKGADTFFFEKSYKETSIEGSKTIGLPSLENGTVSIVMEATDSSGQTGSFTWGAQLIDDPAPEVSVLSPGSGTRFVEGESFTAIASVTDNISVNSVTFSLEDWTRRWSAAEVGAAIEKGELLHQVVRLPSRPESGKVVLKVSAEDNAENSSEPVSVELFLYEDDESPTVTSSFPKPNHEVKPGATLKVRGEAEDNIYIDSIEAVVVDSKKNVVSLPWKKGSLNREDRIKSVTIPNPNGFGSLLAAKRFFTEFTGVCELPETLVSDAGQQVGFKLIVKDKGVNVGESAEITLNVYEDRQGPLVRFDSPAYDVCEDQTLDVRLMLSDESGIDSFTVTEAESKKVLLEKSVTGAPKTYSAHAQFSVPSWVDGGTNKLVFVVEATDASKQANAATESKIVFIYKDKEPKIKSLGSDEDLVKGGPSLWKLVVEDDFSTADKPLVSMGCVTSLSGLG